jgi:topoisomerase-4 subunit A
MQFHPHGDASIGDALVQLGQKDILVDCQGNWGNILTGDGAAAPRYIEARLSKFALEAIFNPKTTQWQNSYDGRNKEPVTLPVKFPLLLAQGVEGIAVGLSSKILPHNFNELLDACIACLRGEQFTLYPDFQTGGYIDVSRYNDGERGGSIKIRAKINKVDSRTLAIKEIPFGRTTASVIDSILKANERNKIKIRKVDDNTAREVEILVHLTPGVSPDKTIDALYAFTDCEVGVSPNCCVINDNKPHFLTVSFLLRHTAERTRDLLRIELEIEKTEQQEALFFASLEQIFIEERIYKDAAFENAASMDDAVAHVDVRLEPFKPDFIRTVTRDDILFLMEIKMGRILRFNAKKNEELIASIRTNIERINRHLDNLTDYAIDWFTSLKKKYGAAFLRRTEIRNFDTIEAATVAEATEKLYINREEGFIGMNLKKDEYVCPCSSLDDVILFFRSGTYRIVRITDKMYVGKDIIHLAIFKRNDARTVYNVVYRDGRNGPVYYKRFFVSGITRDRDYDLTAGTSDSRVLYFSANPNGEAEIIKVFLKPKPRLKVLLFEKDFGEIPIKGRNSRGNLLTRLEVHKITLRQKGASTLGGRQVWFDRDVFRLNFDGRGELLGEFDREDSILVVLRNGDFYLTQPDPANHYEENIFLIEKYDPDKVWTAALFDGEQGFRYLKRFHLDAAAKHQNFLGEHPDSRLHLLTDEPYPRLELIFGGKDASRPPLVVDADQFITVKSFRAKGKRLSSYEISTVNEIEPASRSESAPFPDIPFDNVTGQIKLF